MFILSFGALKAAPINTVSAVPRNLHVYNTAGSTYVDHVKDSCSSHRYYISPSHVKYDAIVSILLSAQIAKKKVQLRYDGCVNNDAQGNVVGVYLSE